MPIAKTPSMHRVASRAGNRYPPKSVGNVMKPGIVTGHRQGGWVGAGGILGACCPAGFRVRACCCLPRCWVGGGELGIGAGSLPRGWERGPCSFLGGWVRPGHPATWVAPSRPPRHLRIGWRGDPPGHPSPTVALRTVHSVLLPSSRATEPSKSNPSLVPPGWGALTVGRWGRAPSARCPRGRTPRTSVPRALPPCCPGETNRRTCLVPGTRAMGSDL